MHRQPLLRLLHRHRPFDAHEAASLTAMIAFVRSHPNCFDRTLDIGHLTGSAWLVNATNDKVLLTHHRKLNMWLQLGGHADGENDLLAVALREAREESGIRKIVPVRSEVFDVDVHDIPAHGSDPPHQHYDVRFLLQATGAEPPVKSHESNELTWFSPEALRQIEVDASVRRMAAKWPSALGIA